jgi:hypothetical protein
MNRKLLLIAQVILVALLVGVAGVAAERLVRMSPVLERDDYHAAIPAGLVQAGPDKVQSPKPPAPSSGPTGSTSRQPLAVPA